MTLLFGHTLDLTNCWGGCLYISVLLFLLVSWIDVLKAHLSVLPSNWFYIRRFYSMLSKLFPESVFMFFPKFYWVLDLPAVSLERARSIRSNLVLSLQLIIRLQPMAAEHQGTLGLFWLLIQLVITTVGLTTNCYPVSGKLIEECICKVVWDLIELKYPLKLLSEALLSILPSAVSAPETLPNSELGLSHSHWDRIPKPVADLSEGTIKVDKILSRHFICKILSVLLTL